MRNLKQTYEHIKAILDLEHLSIDDMSLYEEMIHINKGYGFNLDDRTLELLHSITMESYLYFDTNADMHTWGWSIISYFVDSEEDISTFLQHFNKWVLFEKINEAMEG